MKVSFKDVSDGFEPLPAGAYEVEIDKAYWKKSSNGNPMVVWEMKVVNNANPKLNKRKLFNYTVANDNPFALMAMLKAVGETDATLKADDFDVVPEKYIGKRLLAEAIQEDYEKDGETKVTNRVKSVAPTAGAAAAKKSGLK